MAEGKLIMANARVRLEDSAYQQQKPVTGIEPIIEELLVEAGIGDETFSVTVTEGTKGSPALQRRRIRLVEPLHNGIRFKVQPGDNDTSRKCILALERKRVDDLFSRLAKVLSDREGDDDEDDAPAKPANGAELIAGIAGARAVLRALREKSDTFKAAEHKLLEATYGHDGLVKQKAEIEEKLRAFIEATEAQIGEIDEKIADNARQKIEAEKVLSDPEYKDSVAQFESLKKDLGL